MADENEKAILEFMSKTELAPIDRMNFCLQRMAESKEEGIRLGQESFAREVLTWMECPDLDAYEEIKEFLEKKAGK